MILKRVFVLFLVIPFILTDFIDESLNSLEQARQEKIKAKQKANQNLNHWDKLLAHTCQLMSLKTVYEYGISSKAFVPSPKENRQLITLANKHGCKLFARYLIRNLEAESEEQYPQYAGIWLRQSISECDVDLYLKVKKYAKSIVLNDPFICGEAYEKCPVIFRSTVENKICMDADEVLVN